jgi:cytoskeleton protein RodZ
MADDIGAYLREARERAGITLRDVATATKISVPALDALERNDIARLPGGIFVRAFVRAYAKQVGLDPEDAVRRFVARFPDTAVEESPARFEGGSETIGVDEGLRASRLWRIVWWVLPIVLVVVYFGFGGRVPWWGGQAQPAAPRAGVPSEPVPPGPATPILTTPAPPAVSEAPATPPASPAQEATTPARGGQPDAAAAAAAAAPAADVQTGSNPEGRFRLTLSAKGLCWVTVRSNGVIQYTATMKAGERKDIDVWGRVSLTVGDAGAMELAINGQPSRSLGAEGEVVTWLMTIQNLNTFLQSR